MSLMVVVMRKYMRTGKTRASSGNRAQAQGRGQVCPCLLSNLTFSLNAQADTLSQLKLAEME